MDFNKIIEDMVEKKINEKIKTLKEEIETELYLSIYSELNSKQEKDTSKKIAICLSGHTRNFIKNYCSIKKYILNKYDADIFIHTWEQVGHVINTVDASGNPKKIIDNSQKANIDNIKTLYNPKKIIVENQLSSEYNGKVPKRVKQNAYKAKNHVNNNLNYYGQMYTISYANNLKIEYEKENNITYDYVIRMRFDYILDDFKDEWFDDQKIVRFMDAFWIAPNKINDTLTDLYNYYYNIFVIVKHFNYEGFVEFMCKKFKIDDDIDTFNLPSGTFIRSDNKIEIAKYKKFN